MDTPLTSHHPACPCLTPRVLSVTLLPGGNPSSPEQVRSLGRPCPAGLLCYQGKRSPGSGDPGLCVWCPQTQGQDTAQATEGRDKGHPLREPGPPQPGSSKPAPRARRIRVPWELVGCRLRGPHHTCRVRSAFPQDLRTLPPWAQSRGGPGATSRGLSLAAHLLKQPVQGSPGPPQS